jgi:hypothetical protein
MKASFVELRTKSREIRHALERNEEVTVTYRGKPFATMKLAATNGTQAPMRVEDCAMFGMWADREDMKDPVAWVRELRKPRFTFHPVPKRRE